MGWTMNFGAYPPHWDELPEQIAVMNDDGGWDAYMLTSKAMRMIRDAKDDANWLHAELHGVELEARKAELGAVAMTEENMAAHGWVRERTCERSRHDELFGTPERAARTLYYDKEPICAGCALMGECEKTPDEEHDTCFLIDYDELLEWLRGDAK